MSVWWKCTATGEAKNHSNISRLSSLEHRLITRKVGCEGAMFPDSLNDWGVGSRAVENAESARSVIYAIFSAHSAYFNVSRQKVPYFNVSRQNRVVFKTVLQQNNVEAC